jgi:hypothetical protein
MHHPTPICMLQDSLLALLEAVPNENVSRDVASEAMKLEKKAQKAAQKAKAKASASKAKAPRSIPP